jgi:hypothetical protein
MRLAKWKQYAESWHKKDTEMFEGLMKPLSNNVVRASPLMEYGFSCIHGTYFPQAKGDDDQSLGATLIRNAEKSKLSSKELSWLAGTL